MGNLLINAFWQIVVFVGCVYLVGFIISLINRFFYKTTGYSKLVIYGTGFIGTPIHETSHLLMCLLFRHRINGVKFFQINDEDGVLGYVNHSWNPRNIYQQIGNYFIGVAPIVVGTLILFGCMKAFLPSTYNEISEYFSQLALFSGNVNVFGYFSVMFTGMITEMFAEISIGWQWWVFMIIAICVSLHMNLSGADIKGSVVAIPLLAGLLIVVNLILGLLFKNIYKSFLAVVNNLAGFLLCTLVLALVLSAICLILAQIIRLIIWGFGRIFRR